MYIIPAIDIIGGRCVRLTQGDYARQTVYDEDPLDAAKRFEDAGLERLHLVDLDGAKAGHIINYKVIERIAARTRLHLDVGGGLKSDEDLKIAFASGARQVTGGTVAVKQPAVFRQWLQQYGSEAIILGADVKDEKIAVSGWLEQSEVALFPFLAEYLEAGVQYAICTDIAKDGMMEGSAIVLYQRILAEFPSLRLIASGGISSVEELEKLREVGCFGAIVGKAIYEQKISLAQLARFS